MSETSFSIANLPNTGSLIGGKWIESGRTFEVKDKFTGARIADVSEASPDQVKLAVSTAKKAFDTVAHAPYDRAQVLKRAAALLDQYRSRFVDLVVADTGFTLSDAAMEVDRAIVTLNLSADEAVRLVGEQIPFAASPGAHQRLGWTQRFPLGVVCAITPFNSPLNTVLHKVAPAYAAGNAVVLKPSAFTPLTAALLGEVLLEAGMHPGFINIVQGEGGTVGTCLLEDQDIAFYTFTGSTRVGRIIQQAAGLRRTQMELGSIASTIVCADADLDRAISKIASAGFRKAGQVCTSVQRLYAHQSIFDDVVGRLVACAKTLTAGDPRQPSTRVGPLISGEAAARAEAWIREAEARGARIHCGGRRTGSVIEPTVLTGFERGEKIWCAEAFAPIIAVHPFDTLDEAFAGANDTPYGLSAGVFTRDINVALRAAKTLRFGTVQVNEASSARSDVMPFGGVKDSGFGKEGPAYSIKEMTEERLIIFNP